MLGMMLIGVTLWCTLLLVLCGASLASYVSASTEQQEANLISLEKYHSSNHINKYLESAADVSQQYQRQLPQTEDENLEKVTIVDYSAPSPLSGLKIPFSASSTDPCGDGTNEFETESGGVRWKTFPVTYAIDTTNSGVDPAIARNAVIKAFDEFDNYIPDQAFTISNDFNTAKITFEWQSIDGPSGALGIATYFFNPDTLEIDSAEIVLDSDDSWFASAVQSCTGMGNSHDIQNIATHELGHAVGLDHVADALQTMYPTSTAGETLKRSLGNGDRAGINFLYPGWSEWSALGGVLKDNSNPSVTANSDNRLEAFVIGSNNQLYHKWQNTAGTTTNWSPFLSLSGVIKPNTSPAVIMNSDGRLEVFVIGNNNQLYHKWQNTAGTTTDWSPFLSLGGVIKPNSSPAVARNFDGRLEVFVVQNDNGLWHKWQNTAGTTTNWSPLFGLSGVIKPNSSPAVIMNSDGRLEVFVIGNNNQLYHKWQNTAGTTTNWSPFVSLGGTIAPNTSPAVIMNSDGRLEVFVVNADNTLHHKSQTLPGSSTWSAFESLDGNVDINTSAAVARNLDGRLEAFVVGTDNGLYHKWQTIS